MCKQMAFFAVFDLCVFIIFMFRVNIDLVNYADVCFKQMSLK